MSTGKIFGNRPGVCGILLRIRQKWKTCIYEVLLIKEGAAPFNRAALETSVDSGGDPPSMINIFSELLNVKGNIRISSFTIENRNPQPTLLRMNRLTPYMRTPIRTVYAGTEEMSMAFPKIRRERKTQKNNHRNQASPGVQFPNALLSGDHGVILA